MQDFSSDVTQLVVGGRSEHATALLSINGMTCAACVGAVERALHAVPGVAEVSVSLMGKRGQVFFDSSRVAPPALVDAVIDAGYEAKELRKDAAAVTDPNAFQKEAEYYRGQFLGSLPLAFGALCAAKLIPMWGRPAWRAALETEVVSGSRGRSSSSSPS